MRDEETENFLTSGRIAMQRFLAVNALLVEAADIRVEELAEDELLVCECPLTVAAGSSRCRQRRLCK